MPTPDLIIEVNGQFTPEQLERFEALFDERPHVVVIDEYWHPPLSWGSDSREKGDT